MNMKFGGGVGKDNSNITEEFYSILIKQWSQCACSLIWYF